MKIDILISWPLNKRAMHRLGIDVLKNHEVEFRVLNLFELIYRKTKDVYFEKLNISEEVVLQSYKELEGYLLDKNVIFNFLNFKKETFKTFYLINKLNIEYVSFDIMPLPTFKKSSFKKTILNKFASFFLKSASVGAVVKEKGIFPFSPYKTKFILINSIDYDTYLRFERKKTESLVKEKYLVFVDQNMTGHLDYVRKGRDFPVTEMEYVNSLNNYFDYIEKKFNFKVVIALHPNSDMNKNIYGNRITIKDNTINLVKYSEGIITHYSTAVSFAVIYDKPITFIYTNEILNSKEEMGYIFNFAEFFNIRALNIDLDKNVNFITDNYDLYMQNYITNTTTKKLTMEILLESFE